MVYLAREGKNSKHILMLLLTISFIFLEETETATIVWYFDFTKAKMSVKDINLRFDSKTYENGHVDLFFLNKDGKMMDSLFNKNNLKMAIINFLQVYGLMISKI